MAGLDESTILDNVKEDLALPPDDDVQDSVLLRLIKKVTDHFKLAYGVDEVDERFGFIIEDCVIKRYNRRGAEGASSETLESHSVSYEAVKYEFAPYDDLLQRELKTGKAKPGRLFVL